MSLPTRTTYGVPCPCGRCEATVQVPEDLLPGEYACPCGAHRVRVAWDVYLTDGRRPRLTEVEEVEA